MCTDGLMKTRNKYKNRDCMGHSSRHHARTDLLTDFQMSCFRVIDGSKDNSSVYALPPLPEQNLMVIGRNRQYPTNLADKGITHVQHVVW